MSHLYESLECISVPYEAYRTRYLKKQIWCPVVAMAGYATTHATQLHDVGDTTYELNRLESQR